MRESIVTGLLGAAALIGSARAQEVVSAQDARARDLSRLFYNDTLQQQPAQPSATPAPAIPAGDGGGNAPASAAQPVRDNAPVKNGPPTGMTRRVGLKYQILLQGPRGDVRIASPAEEFHSKDRIRIQIESNVDGYLYIFQKGSSGRESTLFPDPDINDGCNDVNRGVLYSTPDDSWFVFDNTRGDEQLLVVVSRKPLDWVRTPGRPTPVAPPAVTFAGARTVLDQSVSSRDLVIFDQAGPAAHGRPAAPQARIAVNNNDRKNDLVYVEIVLKHR
jgi:hypothetical protein